MLVSSSSALGLFACTITVAFFSIILYPVTLPNTHVRCNSPFIEPLGSPMYRIMSPSALRFCSYIAESLRETSDLGHPASLFLVILASLWVPQVWVPLSDGVTRSHPVCLWPTRFTTRWLCPQTCSLLWERLLRTMPAVSLLWPFFIPLLSWSKSLLASHHLLCVGQESCQSFPCIYLWLTRFWLSSYLPLMVSISTSSGCRLPSWEFFPHCSLLCERCFGPVDSRELQTPFPAFLHVLLTFICVILSLSLHTLCYSNHPQSAIFFPPGCV